MSNSCYLKMGKRIKENKEAQERGAGKPCLLCGNKTTGKVEVQINIFRGDDEVEPICIECQKINTIVLMNLISNKRKEINYFEKEKANDDQNC